MVTSTCDTEYTWRLCTALRAVSQSVLTSADSQAEPTRVYLQLCTGLHFLWLEGAFIARRHFFIREMVENDRPVVPYVRSIDNLADFFTKPLPASVFFAMRDKIMNIKEDSPPSK